MLGAIIGDIVGSIYEFNNHKSKEFEFFGKGCSFTDDTVHTIAVADWMLNRNAGGPGLADRLVHWSKKYPHKSYGGMFYQWLSGKEYDGKYKPYNSFGNGSAMRVSPCGWHAKSEQEAIDLATLSAEVTHNHPQGILGAKVTALAIYKARMDCSAEDIKKAVIDISHYDLSQTVDEIRPSYHFNETCQGTVPQAIVCALEAVDFEDAIRNAVSIGGDSDTVAAITGSIAEAMFGIPDDIVKQALNYLPAEMIDVVNSVNKHTNPQKNQPSSISKNLIAAYNSTRYRVFTDIPFNLRIGQRSPHLLELYKKHDCLSAALITAWNPYSVVTSESDNTAAQLRLETVLSERSVPFISAIGEDPEMEWRGEESVLALNLNLNVTKELGFEFLQNAVVWSGQDAVPQLVLLR